MPRIPRYLGIYPSMKELAPSISKLADTVFFWPSGQRWLGAGILTSGWVPVRYRDLISFVRENSKKESVMQG